CRVAGGGCAASFRPYIRVLAAQPPQPCGDTSAETVVILVCPSFLCLVGKEGDLFLCSFSFIRHGFGYFASCHKRLHTAWGRDLARRTALLTAASKRLRFNSSRPAIVVPPGEVTRRRSSAGSSRVSISMCAAPKRVCRLSWRAISLERPASTPACSSASTMK